MPIRTHRWLLLVLVSALCAVVVAGCNLLAAGYFVVNGPPKVPSVYTLDPERPTVVYVDDRANRLPRRALRQTISRGIEQTLLEHEAVEDMIASRSATIATSSESFEQPMSLVEIGRSVGAEVLIWVAIDSFSLSPDGVTYLPTARVRVKIVDVVTGQRLWPPADQEVSQIPFAMNQQQGTVPTKRSETVQAYEQLAGYVGIGIAQMFYEHEKMDTHR